MSGSSDEEEKWATTQEFDEATNKSRDNVLPTKSRKKYESIYDAFVQWKESKNVNLVTENVILAYFSELEKKYKPPTLWSIYSMLRSTLNIKDKIDLQNFKLTAFLKQISSGYQAKKTKVFSADDIKTFLDTAPDHEYLVTKVALIFGVCGACRGDELINLTVDDVRNYDDVMVIKLRDMKNKTSRNFIIEGEFLKTVLAYQALRPEKMNTNRFFVSYRNGHCTRQVIGKNKLGGMPREIATFLNLPDPHLYTGHSLRRSSATLRTDKGADIIEIKRLGDWKSTAVAEGYTEDSIGYKRKTGQQISDAIAMASTSFQSLMVEGPAKRQKIDETDNEENSKQAPSQIFISQIPPESSINIQGQSMFFPVYGFSSYPLMSQLIQIFPVNKACFDKIQEEEYLEYSKEELPSLFCFLSPRREFIDAIQNMPKGEQDGGREEQTR